MLRSFGRFNASGRPLIDHVVAMPIDTLEPESHSYHVLKTPGFDGVNGDGSMNLVGMTGEETADGMLHLWFVNARPSINAFTGELLSDAEHAQVGGNSTIEKFSFKPGADEMHHVKTFTDPQIATPNNIAVVGDGSFYYTNDHGLHKVGKVGTASGWLSNLGSS